VVGFSGGGVGDKAGRVGGAGMGVWRGLLQVEQSSSLKQSTKELLNIPLQL